MHLSLVARFTIRVTFESFPGIVFPVHHFTYLAHCFGLYPYRYLNLPIVFHPQNFSLLYFRNLK